MGKQKGFDLVKLSHGNHVEKDDIESPEQDDQIPRSMVNELETLRNRMRRAPRQTYKYVWRNQNEEYVGYEDDKDVKNCDKYELLLAAYIVRRMWLRLLLSFKRLTVLFHEVRM